MNSESFSSRGKQRKTLGALAKAALAAYFLLTDPGYALNPAWNILQYNCQTWGRQTGLPANGISSITQTKDGYLWLGTAIGLIRFDGTEFKVMDMGPLPEAWSSGIVEGVSRAGDGGLWVALESSTYGYCDGQSFSIRSKDAWNKVDPSIQYVRAVLESKSGTLWLGTDRGVMRLTDSKDYEEVIGSSSNALFKTQVINVIDCNEDREGRIWFGTAENGVYCWQSGKITKIPDPSLDDADVFAVAEDMAGQIWIGTPGGLRCYDKNFARKDIPALYTEVRTILADRTGGVWIGTTGQGLALYRNGAYSFLRKTNGLANDYVKSLTEDQEGSLWIGTREGVTQLTDVKFTTYPACENGEEPEAVAVGASRKGGIWVGSVAGLTYFDCKPKTYGVDAGLGNLYTKRVFEASSGDVYFVSGIKDLMVFSGRKVVATYSAPNLVVGMAEDEHGVVVSVGGLLYRAGRDYFTPYVFTNGEPRMDWILNLASGRDGELWVACNTGVFRVKDGRYRQWGAAEGLSDPRAQWVCQDNDGTVWGATLNGIFRLKENEIKFISRKDGLFDNNIYSIVPDDLGNLWMDSGRGIFKVSRESINACAEGKTNLVDYVAYDGPESVKPSDKTSQEHVACKTPDGRIWFPSANGVVEINPAHVPSNRIAPPVHIDSLRANGVEMSRSNRLVVPPGSGELEIRFSALSFIAPHSVTVRYWLEGYDKNWVETKDRHVAFYTNLKPGHYKFRVIAANSDGFWNETGDSIDIELSPHYYQTVWFHVLLGVLVGTALLGIVSWRFHNLKRKQEELQKTRRLLEAEVMSRTAQLARANTGLQQKTQSLEVEIEARKRMQQEVERAQRELIEISRRAGMSEIATNVLHNVGNVLNSVNISTSLVTDNLKKSKLRNLGKVNALLKEHEHDLGTFITNDPKGRQLPAYLATVSERLVADQAAALEELDSLRKNIDYIKEIVVMQQNYARVSGVKETVDLPGLIEDSLRMNKDTLEKDGVQIVRDFRNVPPISVEKHKILQILTNLLRNAKNACDEAGCADKRLTVRLANGDGRIKISVMDNGVGIPPENLTRIFSHGFTTRSNGHGFGLNSGALTAKELGGTLTAHSDGPGKGATFTLDLPIGPTVHAN